MALPKGMVHEACRLTGQNLSGYVVPINTPLVIGHFTHRVNETDIAAHCMTPDKPVLFDIRVAPDDSYENLYWIVVQQGPGGILYSWGTKNHFLAYGSMLVSNEGPRASTMAELQRQKDLALLEVTTKMPRELLMPVKRAMERAGQGGDIGEAIVLAGRILVFAQHDTNRAALLANRLLRQILDGIANPNELTKLGLTANEAEKDKCLGLLRGAIAALFYLH